jgi:hypothetical protein
VLNQAHQPIQVGGSANTTVANNIFVRADNDTSMISRFWNDDATVLFTNNLFWNTVGATGEVPAGNLIGNPQWTSARGLTRAQTDLLATVVDIYAAKGASAELRRPTKNNGFPTHNFKLKSTSPAIDAGLDYGYRTFSGTAVDLGAFEYTAP